MPLSTAIETSDAFRAALLRRERASAVRLIRAYGGVYQRLQTQLEALTAELDVMVAKGESVTPWKVQRMARLKNLQKQVAEEVTRYGAVLETEIDQGAKAAIAQAQKDARALTQAALPGLAPIDVQIMAQWQSLNPGAVESMLGFLADDSPLRLGLRTKFGPMVADGVAKQLVESLALGYNPRKTAAALRSSLGMGLESALKTARTAQLYAYRESTRAAYIANSDIVPQWQWRSARDSRVCASCLAMDGTLHAHTERLNDHWQGRCLAPGTLVSGPVANAFVARHYQGDLLTIRTATGKLLSVTPNHPILTDAGWVAAGLLNEGDYVVCDSGLQGTASGMRPDEYQMPTLIEDVPRALNMHRLGSMPTAAEDFHGDGEGSQVHVVSINGLLRNRHCAACGQPALEQQFCRRHLRGADLPGRSDLPAMLVSMLHAPGGFLSKGNSAQMFLHRRLRCAETIGAGLVTPLNTYQAQAAGDSPAGYAVGFGQAFLGFASEVASGNVFLGQGQQGTPLGTGLFANYAIAGSPITEESLLSEYAYQPRRVDTKTSTNHFRALAGSIRLDCIVNVSSRWYSGHVYNLQTTAGYYIANGIITHNCAMLPAPVTYRDLGLDVDEPPDTLDEPTGEAWFRAQPEATQKAVLGPGKHAAWQAGQFDFAQLSQVSDDPVWGKMRTETPLKDLVPEAARQAA